jgi:hypothetical protein
LSTLVPITDPTVLAISSTAEATLEIESLFLVNKKTISANIFYPAHIFIGKYNDLPHNIFT